MLLFARPYVPGQRIRVMSGALNGPHVGVIVSAGLLYTVLDTDAGPLNIPNSSLLASAVGPAPPGSEAAPGDAAGDPGDQDDGASTAVVLAAAEAAAEGTHKHPGAGTP
ncbi:mechanosensitive ion channel family protein [Actinoplanes subtropicus]|uniref:mechanosensitive ion channel family protein n=1 Tax=Actinoplanes subtropicus TaxID=543632 RepID=UPI0004C39312|nr:mechanosensitive ion channel family protein [Actinoplanes subtropicus]